MSVVNKMLQDLEARQSKTDQINADYHAPQKKHSKLLILILSVLVIAATIFALSNKSQLFGDNKNTEVAASANTESLPPAVAKRMSVVGEKVQPEQVIPQIISVQASTTNSEQVAIATDIMLADNVLADGQITQNEPKIATDNLAPFKYIDTQDEPVGTQSSTAIDPQTTSEPTSSFSMSSSSLKSNAGTLKQRIAESINNANLDLALSLLSELLVTEPNNIKARKKLASLLFAQGNPAQSKQLLIQGIELHPSKSDLRLMLARLYVVQKEPSQAMDILAEFKPSTEIKTEYLAYRASLAQQLKQTELAKSDYQTLTNLESANAKWWLGLAIAEDQLGEMKLAVQAYNRASSLGQLDGAVHEFIQQRISILSVLTGAQ